MSIRETTVNNRFLVNSINSKYRLILTSALLALLVVFGFPSAAQQKGFPPAFELNNDTTSGMPIPNANCQFLQDSHKLTIAQVSSPAYAALFKANRISEQDLKNFWLRYKIKNKLDKSLEITLNADSYAEFYISDTDSVGKWTYYQTGSRVPWSKRDGLKLIGQIIHKIPAHGEITVYQYNITYSVKSFNPYVGIKDKVIESKYVTQLDPYSGTLASVILGILLFAALVNLFFFVIIRERVYLFYSVLLVFAGLTVFSKVLFRFVLREHPLFGFYVLTTAVCVTASLFIVTVLHFLRVDQRYPRWYKALLIINTVFTVSLVLYYLGIELAIGTPAVGMILFIAINALPFILLVSILVIGAVELYKKQRAARLFGAAILPIIITFGAQFIIPNTSQPAWLFDLVLACMLWALVVISWSLFDRFRMVMNENLQRSLDNERLLREKEEQRLVLMAEQKDLLERQVEERTVELKQSLSELKQAQSQLLQSEKMASLGELTAGIAHEIQNPLNFVNNFSEVSVELVAELKEEAQAGRTSDVLEIAEDLSMNLEKISHHGKRADNIVKGMLEHSRTSAGQTEFTDLNKLAAEYLQLAYHGMRAKDKEFNATMITEFDEQLPRANVIPQEIGRVLLNLLNNAFYAMAERQKIAGKDFEPTLRLTTRFKSDYIMISVKDNGTGIPEAVLDKIMQPFFTTKPTGQGTGLGLSLSYDIVVKTHGGKIEVQSVPGEGAEFVLTIPVKG